MNEASYDVIVMGVGGVGSAAAFHLAKRGLRVLGLEQFTRAHALGSSHGHTRIIRQAYFEHPNYVPLLKRSYELWEEVEHQTGRELYRETGLLEAGPSDGVVCPGVIDAAEQHDLRIEILTAPDACKRWPGFVIPDSFQAVFEQEAGYLLVEDCVGSHIELAEAIGADLKFETEIRNWKRVGQGIEVESSAGRFQAANLVITTGAWARPMLNSINIESTVVRKHLHWFANNDRSYHVDEGCPVFFFENAEGYFYGFPQCDDRGVKIAEHSGGDVVIDPTTCDRSEEQEDLERVADFLTAYLPGVSKTPTNRVVCMYTRTPDEHFVVDHHPEFGNVALVAGLSGHGFKFTPVLGEILADLTIDSKTRHPIEFLRSTRFG